MTPRWRDVPRTTREEVRRLAHRGYPHPDPAVQQAAAAWGARARRHAFWMSPFVALAPSPPTPANPLIMGLTPSPHRRHHG
ncbi:hypothetical protein AB0M47_13895 [Hamadaea sp. NPDC051192]|uniref:hypothetical protein n=1 Tax=Hamadaea sp. NPDC051192 TaxID=3154940 RepID=UPI00342C0BF0